MPKSSELEIPFRLPKLNLLYSYAFLRGDDDLIGTGGGLRHLVEALSPYTNLLVDSGAVTNYNETIKDLKRGREPDPIGLDEYIAYCHGIAGRYYGYISLDVVGNPQATKRNLFAMAETGLSPIPVFTYNENLSALPALLEVNPYVAVGFGGRRALPPKQRASYRRISAATSGKIKIHGLGFSRYPDTIHLPIVSGDASSWCSGGRYGTITWFDRQNGIQAVKWRKFERKPTIMRKLYGILRGFGIPAHFLLDMKYFYKNYGIPAATTVHAFLRMHEATAKAGFKFFFAVPNITWSISLLATLSSVTPLGFDYEKLRIEKIKLDDLWRKDRDVCTARLVEIVRTKTQWE